MPTRSKIIYTFTDDYFNIKIDDAIVSTERQFALAQCYGGGDGSGEGLYDRQQ